MTGLCGLNTICVAVGAKYQRGFGRTCTVVLKSQLGKCIYRHSSNLLNIYNFAVVFLHLNKLLKTTNP